MVNAAVMDTSNASWENKPLKETEGLLDDASPVLGCYLLAAVMQTNKKSCYSSRADINPGRYLSVSVTGCISTTIWIVLPVL